MFSDLSDKRRVAGVRQTLKAIRQGRAEKVYVASDIDPVIFDTVVKAAKEAEIPVEKTDARELGKLCGIDVPTSAAAQTAKL